MKKNTSVQVNALIRKKDGEKKEEAEYEVIYFRGKYILSYEYPLSSKGVPTYNTSYLEPIDISGNVYLLYSLLQLTF